MEGGEGEYEGEWEGKGEGRRGGRVREGSIQRIESNTAKEREGGRKGGR